MLSGFEYSSIDERCRLDARSRLAWLKANDETSAAWAEDHNLIPNPTPYRVLSTVLRRQGHERNADKIMTRLGWRRMVPLLMHRLRGTKWDRAAAGPYFAASLLYGAIVGHGYARFRPLVWLLGFWVLGIFIFGSIANTSIQPTQGLALRAWTAAQAQGWNATPRNPGALAPWIAADPTRAADPALSDTRWIASYPRFSAAVYSLDAFLPLVDFHQEEAWTPRGGAFGTWAWFVRTIYLPFHIIMGWVIATLFAASFTKLTRHD